jgi:hypothetical protein
VYVVITLMTMITIIIIIIIIPLTKIRVIFRDEKSENNSIQFMFIYVQT